jgi:hypothetical protein
MKILAIEKEIEGATSEDFQPYLKAEAQKVWELQQQNIIREIYFGVDRSCAVLILECNSVDGPETIFQGGEKNKMDIYDSITLIISILFFYQNDNLFFLTPQTLPLVQANLIEFEIIPLKPYPGFERLFNKNINN